MRKSILSCLILLSSYLGLSQDLIYKSLNDFISFQNSSAFKKVILTENEIKGSAYLNAEFVSGSIISEKNIHYQDVPLRYNIYNDDIEFKIKEDVYLAISNPNSLKEIKIGDKTFIYDKKDNKKSGGFGYYQLISPGETQLLSCYNITYRASQPTDGIKPYKPARFERNANTFYLKIGDRDPVRISKKKDLQLLFGDKSKRMLTYLKKEKLNIRKEDGLKELVLFINQMK